MSNKSIEKSLIETIQSYELKDLCIDYLEVGIDSMLESGALKDLPFVSTLVTIPETWLKIREKKFAKTIITFLDEIRVLTQNERMKVVDAIAAEKEGVDNVGSVILTRLEELDDEEKPRLVGKLFVACAKGSIDTKQFFRLSSIISKTYIDDIKKLKLRKSISQFTDQEKSLYAASHLMHTSLKPMYNLEKEITIEALAEILKLGKLELDYQFTEEAEIIAEICFGIDRPSDLNLF